MQWPTECVRAIRWGNGTLVAEGLYRLTVAPLVYYYAVDSTAKVVEVSVIREVRP